MRTVDISSLRFSPVQYLPGQDLLKVYHRVRAEIFPVSTREPGPVQTSEFEPLLRRIVRIDRAGGRKAIRADSPVTMVILSDTLFREALQPLVQWKTRKGFHVVEAYLQDSVVGQDRGRIRDYLAELYHAPSPGMSPPSYLLIVGDVKHIPLSQASGQVTDLYYATYDGAGDYIPDLFYGRISVESPGQLEGVLEKILDYEQFRLPDPSFLGESVLIAGVDAAFAQRHGNGQLHYAGSYYLNEANGNRAHTFFYPESDTSDRRILDLISGGVGFVNYTGHGLSDRWINPAFHQDDIAELQNLHRYPVMIGNGCETNVFHLDECFAEALLRAPGKGALAYIGCTNDSYWDEDYFWAVGVGPIGSAPLHEESGPGYYDRTFHLFGEPYPLWTPSLGEMVAGGNLSVQQSTSPRKKFYWEIYQLAGDPSLVPWFRVPDPPEVNHPQVIPPGSRRLDLTCRPYSYAALSREGVLLDAGHAGAHGTVTLQLPGSMQPEDLDVVVTGANHAPYFGKVMTGIPSGAHLSLLDYRLTAESVESDGLVSRGEWFSLDLEWVNAGNSPTAADTLLLRTPGEELAVTDSLITVKTAEPGDTFRISPAFRIRCSGSAGDMDEWVLSLVHKRSGEEAPIYLREHVVAPRLQSGGIRWDDRVSGNGNGVAEEGEWLFCSWKIYNAGHFRSDSLGRVETDQGPGLFDRVDSEEAGILPAGDSMTVCFHARVGPNPGYRERSGLWIAEDISGGIADSCILYPGRFLEDFNQGRLDRFPFVQAGAAPWSADREFSRSEPYSVRSGEISNNGWSRISIMVEADRSDTISFWFRVSSEQGYDFLQFHVDSVMKGRWSGESGWNSYSFAIEPGIHELAWSYTKDQSISRGEDAAWIDDVAFNASAFRQQDLSLMAISEPRSGPWLGKGEQVALLIKNTGRDSVSGCSVRIDLKGVVLEDSLQSILPPGSEQWWVTDDRFDLSELGTYIISASIGSPADQFAGNNALQETVLHYSFPDLSLRLAGIREEHGEGAEAHLELTNAGNILIDSLYYGIWISGSLVEKGRRPLHLPPGKTTRDTFLLTGHGDLFPVSGIHEFQIRSLTPDSVLSNSVVRGTFQWQAVNKDMSRFPPEVEVSPNPSRHGFRVLFRSPTEIPATVELIGSDGRLAVSRRIGAGTRSLFLPAGSLDAGIYILSIRSMGVYHPVVITP